MTCSQEPVSIPMAFVPTAYKGTRDQARAGLRTYLQSTQQRDFDDEEKTWLDQSADEWTGDQYNAAITQLDQRKPAKQKLRPQVQPPPQTQPPPQQQPPPTVPPYMQAGRPNFTQFTRTPSPYDAQVDGIVNQVLGQPALSDQTVNQLKSRARDNAVAQNAAMKQQLQESLLNRGFTPDGGSMLAADALSDEQLLSDLIDSSVGIDIEAAKTRRGDMVNAVQLAEAIASGRSGRNIAEYGAQLGGEQAQFGDNFNVDQFIDAAMRGDRSLSLQELLGKEGISLDRDRLSTQKSQFDTATKMDLARFLESIRQFDSTFDEGKRQFNNNSAFNWSNFNANQQGRLLDYLSTLFSR
jgi:hypothetical protein